MTVEIPGYKILGTLGKGGMATVYLAEHEIFQRKVALKVMAPGLADDPSFGERFMREARIVSQLVHPHIVTVYDVGVHEGNYYLSMEFVDGQDLKHARKQLSLEQKFHIILDIAKALDYAGNKGYVHRDIKPENIMLYAEDDRAVLMDFGIARAVEMEISMTQTGTAIGTPHYMSPEQAKGQPVDIRSDIYGLGVVFYLLLVGCVPFDAESAVAIGIKHITDPVPELPEGLETLQPIIDKMMAKLPKDRHQKPAELVHDLRRLDVTSLIAAVEEANIHAEASLDSASADAPTIVSSCVPNQSADSAYADKADKADKDSAEAAEAADADDPTPLLVEDDAYELEEQGSSVWPWLAGVVVLLVVVGSVFYSQNQGAVQSWLAGDTAPVQTVTEAPPVVPAETFAAAEPQAPSPQPQVPAQAPPKPAADIASSAQTSTDLSGQNSAALPVPIGELRTQLETDASKLLPLLQALRQQQAVTSNTTNPNTTGLSTSGDAVAEVLASEMKRTRQLARAGDLDAAKARLTQLRSLPAELVPALSPAKMAELEDFVAQQQQVQQWLQEGEAFLASDTLTRPAGNNARARFQQVLTLEPDNARALAGLAKASQRLTELAAQALTNEQFEKAKTRLAKAVEIDPNNKKATNLQAQVAEQAAQAALNEQVQALLAQAETQMQQAAYFNPPQTSAYHYFSQVLALQPGNAAALQGIDRTIEDFGTRLFNLLAAGHYDVVRSFVQRARKQLPGNPELAALELRVEEAIATKLLAQQPRIVDIQITGAAGGKMTQGQPATIQAERTISVSFHYANFPASTSVIQAVLTDGSAKITQVPVVITGSEGNKTFSIDHPVEGFESGRYTINLLFKGRKLVTRDFQVNNTVL